MSEQPPFDAQKWAFLIVVVILMVYVLIPVAGVVSCLIYIKTVISDPKITCDPQNRLSDLLTAALAAALSLYAGLSKKS